MYVCTYSIFYIHVSVNPGSVKKLNICILSLKIHHFLVLCILFINKYQGMTKFDAIRSGVMAR
jgi:hypothetical protein